MASDITEPEQYEPELEQTDAQRKRSNVELERFAYAASNDRQEPVRMVSSYRRLLEHHWWPPPCSSVGK